MSDSGSDDSDGGASSIASVSGDAQPLRSQHGLLCVHHRPFVQRTGQQRLRQLQQLQEGSGGQVDGQLSGQAELLQPLVDQALAVLSLIQVHVTPDGAMQVAMEGAFVLAPGRVGAGARLRGTAFDSSNGSGSGEGRNAIHGTP